MPTMPPRLPYTVHAISLFFLCFTALVLVVLVTFSAPFIPPISFLTASLKNGTTTFGTFGWCPPDDCSDNVFAYEYSAEVNKALTAAMVLWPIAVGTTFLAVLAMLPLLFSQDARSNPVVGNKYIFGIFSGLAVIVVLVGWILSILGWSIAKRSFAHGDIKADLGPAIWMGLTALICLAATWLVGWPAAKKRTPNIAAAHKTTPTTTTTTTTTRNNTHAVPAHTHTPTPQAIGIPPSDGYYRYKRTVRELVPDS